MYWLELLNSVSIQDRLRKSQGYQKCARRQEKIRAMRELKLSGSKRSTRTTIFGGLFSAQ
jgi:hypothetical protein